MAPKDMPKDLVPEEPEQSIKDMSIPDVLALLEADPKSGLTDEEVQARLVAYGPNKLPEQKRSSILVFLGYMWNPLSWAMEVAAIIAIALEDFADFALIIALLLLNAAIGYFEEKSAGDAVAALMKNLAPQCKALRNGEWTTVEAVDLVPGDIIRLRAGDVVPADIKFLELDVIIKCDQSALTGESLPVTKATGSEAFGGSTIKQGEGEAIVHSTGINSFFGRSAALLNGVEETSHLQQILAQVGAFCIISIVIGVIIELAVAFGHYDHSCSGGQDNCPALSNILILIVGGIPVAMPTVLSVTMAIGATQLAAKSAIVTRITAIEELSGMTVLCSDKTGTLTLNELTVDRDSLKTFGVYKTEDVVRHGILSASVDEPEPIDKCIIDAAQQFFGLSIEDIFAGLKRMRFVPFDPVGKRTIGVLKNESTGDVTLSSKGAPQVILNMAHNADEIRDECEAIIADFASRGYRALGIGAAVLPDSTKDNDIAAIMKHAGDEFENCKWELVGLLPIFDPPRHDTKQTIDHAQAMGINVKMITGDQLAIAKETARQLEIPQNIFPAAVVDRSREITGINFEDLVEEADGFAEVFPEHKYEIVNRLQKNKHITGMTGDGVNDAPALKKANVGIAVAGATDAARAAADIVLLTPGLSVIIDAIIGSRKIFQRMKNYATYSITTTVRVILTFTILTCAYNWFFPAILIVILAVLNDGTILTISKDRVTPNQHPDEWNVKGMFGMAFLYGIYLSLTSIAFFEVAYNTTWFQDTFGVRSLSAADRLVRDDCDEIVAADPALGTVEECMVQLTWERLAMLRAAIYLQLSISQQALIFVTRTRTFSFLDRPGTLLMIAFVGAQLIATIIGALGFGGYPDPSDTMDCQFCRWADEFPSPDSEQYFVASVYGTGWGWALLIWIWCIIFYVPLDFVKFFGQWVSSDSVYQTFSGNHQLMPGMNRNRVRNPMSPSTSVMSGLPAVSSEADRALRYKAVRSSMAREQSRSALDLRQRVSVATLSRQNSVYRESNATTNANGKLDVV
eukprot:Clim_evm20s229 gene=Clim_evmTU20s229